MGNTLGSRIRFLRDEKSVSQLEMARQLNISNAQLSRYESGDRKPDPDMIVHIADYFRVSTDYLLGRTGLINEPSLGYNSEEDQKLLEKIKKIPELDQMIDQMNEYPEKANRLVQIWKWLK
ncbi:helix-turn-helix domain-containing protein [Sporolactobacillus shoreicorticis]|uniref:Helix-turn-helix domain-containing protein n=1 Tax=Sporolactobacillus shoreicorticis TaxID=1923877 RepID=A0ABW5SAI1_9BACL|nr:helix-turn-helix transcriptional regulator [Sporolactobacillus shoreicorticis]MCO7127327.1 helix-turn-helix domain-containing protein [Sporolactobacillus shoreicorticis]